jgi:hypothetical protein
LLFIAKSDYIIWEKPVLMSYMYAYSLDSLHDTKRFMRWPDGSMLTHLTVVQQSRVRIRPLPRPRPALPVRKRDAAWKDTDRGPVRAVKVRKHKKSLKNIEEKVQK